jgi:hypothetical protein
MAACRTIAVAAETANDRSSARSLTNDAAELTASERNTPSCLPTVAVAVAVAVTLWNSVCAPLGGNCRERNTSRAGGQKGGTFRLNSPNIGGDGFGSAVICAGKNNVVSVAVAVALAVTC